MIHQVPNEKCSLTKPTPNCFLVLDCKAWNPNSAFYLFVFWCTNNKSLDGSWDPSRVDPAQSERLDGTGTTLRTHGPTIATVVEFGHCSAADVVKTATRWSSQNKCGAKHGQSSPSLCSWKGHWTARCFRSVILSLLLLLPWFSNRTTNADQSSKSATNPIWSLSNDSDKSDFSAVWTRPLMPKVYPLASGRDGSAK